MSEDERKDEPVDLDRTWLCSVVFVDMIKYSRQSQEVQAQWRHRFKQYLTEAIKDGPESERVILDCGDGAAIVFLGDPELAMLCALRLLGAISAEKGPLPKPMHVRIGINLGSVKLVRDINDNLAAAGDGINVGQRVMSFARDNQILVSRSFYDVASLLTDHYAALFKHHGVQKDKHEREHTLYELCLPNAVQAGSQVVSETNHQQSPLDAGQIAQVERSLALIVGPIARHLVRNTSERARSVVELCEALLTFIPTKSDQEIFLEACGEFFPATPEAALTLEERAASRLEPAILEQARKDLAEYIGPMARMLVNRAAKMAPTPAALYEMLAGEIPSAIDRETFLKQSARP